MVSTLGVGLGFLAGGLDLLDLLDWTLVAQAAVLIGEATMRHKQSGGFESLWIVRRLAG
jgi:hypothetical protein